MPLYLYQHPTSKKVVEIIQHMNDIHEYEENGIKFKRIWINPQASFDTKADPFSAKDFAKVTNKKGTVGDLWSRSEEMSNERKNKDGEDKIQNEFFDKFAKSHKGKLHPKQQRDVATKKLNDLGVNIDYGDYGS